MFCRFLTLISALLTFAVSLSAQSITIADSPASAGFGQSVTLTSTVTSSGAGETGRVLFFDSYEGTTALAAYATLNASGSGSVTIATLAVGIHALTACWDNSGSANPPSICPTTVVSPALSLVIYESTAVTLASSNNPVLPGTAITLTATVTVSDGGGESPDGSVTFANGENTLCAAVVLVSSSATCAVAATQLVSGSNALTATYSGDTSLAILSSSQSLTEYVQSASSVSIASVPNPSSYGQDVTFSFAIDSTATTLPEGSILVYDNGAQIASATLSGSSSVGSYLASALTVGSHPITAVYGGDHLHAPSATSAVLTQVVQKASTVSSQDFSLALSPTTLTARLGASATSAVTLTSVNGFAASMALSCSSLPSGVTCVFAGNPLMLAANGSASTTLTLKVAGTSSAALWWFLPLLIMPGWRSFRVRRIRWLVVACLCIPCGVLCGCGGVGTVGYAGLVGTHTISVTASGGGMAHTQSLTLTVTPSAQIRRSVPARP